MQIFSFNYKGNSIPLSRMLFVVTSGTTARKFLLEQLKYFSKQEVSLGVISSPEYEVEEMFTSWGILFFPISMKREPSPIKDFFSLFMIALTICRYRPSLIVYSTPKAALLSSLASFILRVPRRVYHLRGIRHETMTGNKRKFFFTLEKIISACSTSIICNSESSRNVFIDNNISSKFKTLVIGKGSANGVDPEHFFPPSEQQRRQSRSSFGVEDSKFVIGFVGRINEDKGFSDACSSFSNLHSDEALFLVVGPDERKGVLSNTTSDSSIIFTGYVDDPRQAYWAMDVLIFPSFREGFPNVVLEAACCGVPTIGRRVTGTVDAIQDGDTGWLLNTDEWDRSIVILKEALRCRSVVRERGARAREFAIKNFNQNAVWSDYFCFFEQL